ncbi:hypothetical protein [Hafnia alvei]|uniref:Uncharacterized protein n=1 Tax=Hafnia alvei TaxID=569 RepID=A0ABD7PZS0_HAFAL|nr:hypothetical protein [Hafnia alvei]TBL64994.1 hypothetical protein EYY96_21860 [Hafnia alvei]
MKIFLVISLFLFPFFSNASTFSLEPGLYHLEWAYGPNDNYKTVAGVVGDIDEVDGFYYLKNKIDDQSNDEVYIVINKGSGAVFFKHEEIEGGPTIGWANIQLNDKSILIDAPTTKNFYDNTDGDSDRNIKYKVGVKFPGSKKTKNTSEIAPIEILKNDVFKIDCSDYFKSNEEHGGNEKKNDPMEDYSSSVLLSNDGLCNSSLNKNNKAEVLKGWMLFKRIS